MFSLKFYEQSFPEIESQKSCSSIFLNNKLLNQMELSVLTERKLLGIG